FIPALLMLAVVLLLAAQAGSADAAEAISVTARDGRVTLVAHDALLPDILDRLGQAVGMKVRWDFPPPRPALTLDIEDRTPVETVLGILQGLGFNYALRQDPSGERVEELLMMSASMPIADFVPVKKETFGRGAPQPRRPASFAPVGIPVGAPLAAGALSPA